MQDWNDPQLSDGDMPQPKLDRLYELNTYLALLADMDSINFERKMVLLENYVKANKDK
jgi:hypothetical protein